MITNVLMKGPLLLKNLREAVHMAKRCEDICKDFEKHQPPGTVHEWEMVKRKWETDPSHPDPYRVVEKGESLICANSSILTLAFCSIKPQFRETSARGD